MDKEKITKNAIIVRILLLFLISGVLVAVFIFGIKKPSYFVKLGMDIVAKKYEVENKTDEEKTSGELEWKEFVNQDYGIRFEVPSLLLKTKRENVNGYKYFMRFEENKFSEKKGVALGVTERSRSQEVEYIKEMIEKENPNIHPAIKIFDLAGYGATQIDYEEQEGLEARSIVIINDGKFTFSLSTVPEQIERVKSSLMFF